MPKAKKLLVVSIIVGFILSIVFAIAGNQPAFEFICPLTLWCMTVLLALNLIGLGPYKYSCLFLVIGIGCLAVCDTIRFTNHYVLNAGNPYTVFLRFAYVMPTLFFAINETVYLCMKLKGRMYDFMYLFVNTFCFATIGYILTYKYYVHAAGPINGFLDLSYFLFIYIALYVCMMCIQTFFMVGTDDLKRETHLLTLALFFYEIEDMQYVYAEAVGNVPDTNLGDIFYLFWTAIITISVTIQVQKKYVFVFKKLRHTPRKTKTISLLAGSGVACCIVLRFTGFLTPSELSTLIIVLLAYLLMIYLLYAYEMSIGQKELFEEMVHAKTQELKEANRMLHMLSTTDALTKLYNRRFCDILLSELTREKNAVFVLFAIDLNKFKPINDTYGHEMGDIVLAEFGRRMLTLPTECTSCRTGGDEFVVILNTASPTSPKIAECADSLQTLFRTPIHHENYVFNLSASIGAAIYPDDSSDATTLMQYADTAMYIVKRSGNKDGLQFFNKDMTAIISLKERLLQKLVTANPEKDFVLFYQPQIKAETGEVCGFEVFPHIKGELKDVSPADMIPVAEESGILNQLSIWIASTCISQLSEWLETSGKELGITINLSPLQIIDEDFLSALISVSDKYNIPHERITLDVSNSIILGAASSAKESLKEFHANGFSLSLNDFGGGDINISSILECNFSEIKLSRKLVSAEPSKENDSLIESIVRLSKSLEMNVTAVGIETKEQEQHLISFGIETLQGHLYSKPVKAEEIIL